MTDFKAGDFAVLTVDTLRQDSRFMWSGRTPFAIREITRRSGFPRNCELCGVHFNVGDLVAVRAGSGTKICTAHVERAANQCSRCGHVLENAHA